MTVIPKAGHVLIRPVQPKPESVGLVQLADYYDKPETTGVIVGFPDSSPCPHCGEPRESELAIGDLVLFPPSAGDLFTVDGETFITMPEDRILAVLEPGMSAEVTREVYA